MKLTAVLGSRGTVMATTPSRGAMGGEFCAVLPWAWAPCPLAALSLLCPCGYASLAAPAVWFAVAVPWAETAQPTVLTRAMTIRTTTSARGAAYQNLVGDKTPAVLELRRVA